MAECNKGLFRRPASIAHVLHGLAPLSALYRPCRRSLVAHAPRIALALFAISLSMPNRCCGGEETREALALLAECLRTQSRADRVSMRVTTELYWPASADDRPYHQRAESFIRRDGDRLDVSQRYLF